jgi:urease accessory protein
LDDRPNYGDGSDLVNYDKLNLAAAGKGVAVATLAVLWTSAAQAHVGPGEGGGFLAGFAHPISGWDHIAAMVAVGIWGAQLGKPALWLLPVMFPMVMAFGGLLGLLGVPLPGVEIGIAASAIALGAVILLDLKPPLVAAVFLVSVFAIFHGHAHGTELPPGESGLEFSLGFVIATGCLHLIGIGLGTAHRLPWGERALQGMGAVIMALGAQFLWQALA